MAYFDGIKKGDRVWDFRYGWGTVKSINAEEYPIVVFFPEFGYHKSYDFNGKTCKYLNQTLFWDEIKFEVPKKPKIKLKEDKYVIEPTLNEIHLECDTKSKRLGFGRNDKETAEKALKQIKRFARLLALRDQECYNSRGTDFAYRNSYHIYYNGEEEKYMPYKAYSFILGSIYFKTEEDAQKICDILNSGRFDLEGE